MTSLTKRISVLRLPLLPLLTCLPRVRPLTPAPYLLSPAPVHDPSVQLSPASRVDQPSCLPVPRVCIGLTLRISTCAFGPRPFSLLATSGLVCLIAFSRAPRRPGFAPFPLTELTAPSEHPLFNLIKHFLPRIPGSCSPCLSPRDRILRLSMDPAGSLENRVSAMEQLLTTQAAQVPLPGSLPRPSVPLSIALPERYDGNPDQCRGFLMQVGIYVEEHPEMFTAPGAEVRFTISLLTGRAHEWATALWTDQSPLLHSGGEFHRALMEIFDHPAVGRRPGFRLLDCRQGNRTAADFSLEFRTIAAALRWPDDCLQTIFLRALNPDLQDELTSRGEVSSFDKLVCQAVRLDNTVRDRRRRRTQTDNLRALPAPGSDSTEPMQIGQSPLTTTERRRRTQGGLCLYCGGVGHAVSACPVRPRREEPPLPVGVLSMPLSSLTQFTVPVSVKYNGAHRVVRALLDSGAAGNFMDANLARQLRIPLSQLAFPIKVQGVTGEHIREGTIEHRTHPFMLTVGALHTEQMEVFVLPQAKDPLILGLPWLRKHNPSIDWRAGEITMSWRMHVSPV
uniref:DUF4939 domain-containing protein n=1 Tax=Paramormyrops kingsleyae TaxID=1676925 RepID=A0A3B3SFD0_9TELE